MTNVERVSAPLNTTPRDADLALRSALNDLRTLEATVRYLPDRAAAGFAATFARLSGNRIAALVDGIPGPADLSPLAAPLADLLSEVEKLRAARSEYDVDHLAAALCEDDHPDARWSALSYNERGFWVRKAQRLLRAVHEKEAA